MYGKNISVYKCVGTKICLIRAWHLQFDKDKYCIKLQKLYNYLPHCPMGSCLCTASQQDTRSG